MSDRTQVGIIGAGPAGLLLSQLLTNAGIDNIVIDRQSRHYIEGRVRAGVLEWGSVEILLDAGVGERMQTEGLRHDGFDLAFQGRRHRIDLKKLVGSQVLIYGQTELTKDLFSKLSENNTRAYLSVSNTRIENSASMKPEIFFEHQGRDHNIVCDYVAGCDGFHGVSRKTIPTHLVKTYERIFPFGWLGILVERPPVSDELTYANHPRGFALCSMRSPVRSRYYIQCDAGDDPANWSDGAFWDELKVRIGPDIAKRLQPGPSFEKSIAPLRSFVIEPMAYGNLFLAGDAAHIVPPTGAKGLNLAIADVRLLAHALDARYNDKDFEPLETYSERCLRRVWKAERFSWYFSHLMHQFPDHSPFEKRMQQAELDYIAGSESASRAIAENYVGLPIELAG